MATILVCAGALIPAKAGNTAASELPVNNVLACPSGWLQYAYAPPFDSSQIDPVVVVALISGGFLLYLTPWAAAYGFSSLLKLLR